MSLYSESIEHNSIAIQYTSDRDTVIQEVRYD